MSTLAPPPGSFLRTSTDGWAKGHVIGRLLGGARGLVLLLPLAFIAIDGLALSGRMMVAAIAA